MPSITRTLAYIMELIARLVCAISPWQIQESYTLLKKENGLKVHESIGNDLLMGRIFILSMCPRGEDDNGSDGRFCLDALREVSCLQRVDSSDAANSTSRPLALPAPMVGVAE